MSDAAANAMPMKLPMTANIRPLLMLLGLAAAVAAGVGIALWSQSPTYGLLYGNLPDSAIAEITTQLNQAGVKYRLGPGSVMVPAAQLDAIRVDLAKKGLPGTTDFTILEKDPGFGVSQFMENARYQRALENELARTIASVKSVAGARVHLAVPQQSAFVRDRRPVSASVFLELRNGERPGREQIEAIVNLVASSIPELDSTHVTVIDNTGRLLSSPEKDGEFVAREKQLELAGRLEDEYERGIVSLLSPLLGPDRVHAKVMAQIEASSTEEARELYKPDSQVVRSEQTSEEIANAAGGPQGVPGALTNQPPQGGTALPPGAKPAANTAAATAAGPENTSKQATRNYEIDRTVAYTKTPAGRLTRLTAAVVIDNLRTTDADGKVTETPLTEEQLARITGLVRDAVGYDEARGDRVTVVNQSFLTETTAVPEIPTTPIWQNPLVRDVVKILAGLVVLVLLLLMVVKPLVKNIMAAPQQVLVQGVQGRAEGGGAGATPERPTHAIAYEQQVAQARSMVAKDPARVAQVVKDWVQKDE